MVAGSVHSIMMGQVRETQRVPRSCIPCARKKVKCSKTIPCEQFIKRGDGATCIREVVRVGGRVTVAVDVEEDENNASSLRRENSSLRVRIRQLELALAYPELSQLETGISRDTSTYTRVLHSPARIMNDFQTQALGLLTEPYTSLANSNLPSDINVRLLLPTRWWSEIIVEFSLVQLGWVHCAVDTATFLKEHDAFWRGLIASEKSCLTNHGWIAVYLSILAVGIYFINHEDILGIQLLHESFSSHHPSPGPSLYRNPGVLCRTWYDAALRELNLSDCTQKPALSTVQAVAILNLVHKNLGEPSREYILHGMAVNIARLIGIDRLEDENPRSLIADLNRTQRTLGRRLWWTLVICDWMTIWSRPISIQPHSFTTVLDYEDKQSSASSPFEYHKVMARIAAIVRNRVTSMREWSPVVLQASLEELDSLCASLPAHLRYPTCADDSADDFHDADNEPFWNTVQRRLALNCVDAWRISLYVAIMPHILDDPEATKLRVIDDGITAATRIMRLRYTDSSTHFSKFWSVTSGVVSAGTFLALDLICFQNYRSTTQVAEQKDLITLCCKLLEQSSGQGPHGALSVLNRLSHLYDTVLPSSVHKVDRGSLAKIARLVAYPRLWDSLTDIGSILQFLFADSQPTSDRNEDYQPGSLPPPETSPLQATHPEFSCEIPQGEMFAASRAVVGDGEPGTMPYFGQSFPVGEFIGSSVEVIDSMLLSDLPTFGRLNTDGSSS